MTRENIFCMGSISAGLAVIIGAFGAHALAETLDAHGKEIWQTATQYQMYHSLALLILPTLGLPENVSRQAAVMFLSGIVLFSGSLYILALTKMRWWGMVTPFGGLLFIAGWLRMAWFFLRA